MSGAVERIARWAGEWIETWRVAPPFSRRRRELLAVLADDNPDNWVEVHPGHTLLAAAKCSCGAEHDRRGTGESGNGWHARHLDALAAALDPGVGDGREVRGE